MATDSRSTFQEVIEEGQQKGWVEQSGLNPDYPDNALTERHAELLRQSGISADVAAARMYVSITDGDFFKELLHIPNWSRLTPCLLIPIWDVHGNASQCQIRPDNPRVVRGKGVKYESLPAAALRLDIPPATLSDLPDPHTPLVITEGARKADAAVSRGVCCISLIGVWGFRGRNEKGGKSALVDWESIALNGRNVRIVYDSDVTTKSTVNVALQRLKQFLESRGAVVSLIFLPTAEDGNKVGLDDFLRDHTIEDLDKYVGTIEKKSKDAGYAILDNRYVLTRGDNVEPICNFVAKIELEEIKDDGLVQEAVYHIGGATADKVPLPVITVPVEEFGQMYWVEEKWRTRVQVGAGRGMREHLAAAIKTHSLNAPSRFTFTHTGWREIEDHTVYLHATGFIPHQEALNVSMALEGPLTHVRFESSDRSGPSEREIIQTIIDVGATSVVIPILAGVFTSILGDFITLDFALHLEGPTGTYKSEIAAVAQGFWGRDFDARHLPANWSSTAFALEHQAFAAKDMLFVIDDYAPQPGRHATEVLAQKAEVVFRGAGNQAGRARLTSDIELRPEYFARGLILSTGEDAIAGASLNARLLTLRLSPGAIDSVKLARAQLLRDEGHLAQLLQKYIRWIAAKLPFDFQEPYRAHRQRILNSNTLHKRNATSIAKLLVGWEMLCEFLQDEQLKVFGTEVILGLITEQQSIQLEEDLVTKAMNKLRSGLETGHYYLELLDTSDDEVRDRYGYKLVDGVLRSLGTRLGHVDQNGVEYLDPTAVHESVWRNVGATKRGLATALEVAGWIEMSDGRQYTHPVRFRGVLRRVYKLKRRIFELLPGGSDFAIPDQLNIEEINRGTQ